MLMYGGDSLLLAELPSQALSYPTETSGELWAWSAKWCPSNCSFVGDCVYGHCYCHEGYYGADCSNRTCPGDFCSYDTLNHVQSCSHCCAAPWVHQDGQTYVEGVRKVPCDDMHPGTMHGICDGFGACQCAPPFLGTDCSVRDCPDNCTSPDRGYCSVEYPVSRCVCTPPYMGTNCSLKMCLNNCSWPNGECDLVSGLCTCKKLQSPYDMSVDWAAYMGDDCSWVPAFAGAGTQAVTWAVTAIVLAAAAAVAARVL